MKIIKDMYSVEFEGFTVDLGERLQFIKNTMEKNMKFTSYISGIKGKPDDNVVTEEKGDKEEYQKFFEKMLKKWGIESPDELSDEDKKKFYDEVDAGWKSDEEEMKESFTFKNQFMKFFLTEKSIEITDLKGEWTSIVDPYNKDKKWYFHNFASKGFDRIQTVKGQITGKDSINYNDGKKFISDLNPSSKTVTHGDVLYKHDLIKSNI